MNEEVTFVEVLLDRSGSMERLRHTTISSFNEFLSGQQGAGECHITLVQFDHCYEETYHDIDIREAPPLTTATYVPRGSTALWDAMARSIQELESRLRNTPEWLHPARILMVTVTDGLENASVAFGGDAGRKALAKMISRQRDLFKWEFLFLGANQDAVMTASSINIPPSHAFTYQPTSAGTHRNYQALGQSVQSYRAGNSAAIPKQDGHNDK